MAKVVYDHIDNAPNGRNPTEWAKDQECWKALLKKPHEISTALSAELLTRASAQRSVAKASVETDREQQDLVKRASAVPGTVWMEMSNWAKVTGNLESWQRSIVYSVGKRLQQGGQISWKQAAQALKAQEQATKKGFKPGVQG